MKILYAIQGTGNGHISRALDIIPILKQRAKVDLLVSGIQADLALPYPVKYRFNGFSYIFGQKGGIDFRQTWKRSNLRQLWQDVIHLPVTDYHLVITDFEPVSAWSCLIRGVKAVGLSHQNAVLHRDAPKPISFNAFSRAILRYYAPAAHKYGFHFDAWGSGNYTPVIRQSVRKSLNNDLGHITVYLPAYKDKKILKVLSNFPKVRWEVFSKHNLEESHHGNISIYAVDNHQFVSSMTNSSGVLCGAGFETPAEVLFLDKKLMVIPMKGQYEQQCNAAALKELGVPVIKSLKKRYIAEIDTWLNENNKVSVDYQDQTHHIVNSILDSHLHHSIKGNSPERMELSDYSRLAFS